MASLKWVCEVANSFLSIPRSYSTCKYLSHVLVAPTSFFKVSLISPNSTSSLCTYFAVLVTQSCPTLCNPMDCSPPGSSAHVSRQEYWSGLLFPSPWTLPDPGTEPGSPALQADSLPSEPLGKPLYWYESESHSVVSDSLWPHGLYSPWNSPGQNTGVRILSPSPEDLPNPGIKPWVAHHAPHCRWIIYQLSHCRH